MYCLLGGRLKPIILDNLVLLKGDAIYQQSSERFLLLRIESLSKLPSSKMHLISD